MMLLVTPVLFWHSCVRIIRAALTLTRPACWLLFYGCVQEITGTWAWIRAFGTTTFEDTVHSGTYFWVPVVLEMQKMFQTRQMPQSHDELYEKTQLFLAAFKSHMACGGAPVALNEIGDWTAPLLNPDPYPDGFFR